MTTNGPIYQMVEEKMKKYHKCVTETTKSEYCIGYKDCLESVTKEIQELEPRWIPVEERLPEANFDVLIVHQGETKMGYCEDEVWYNSCTHRRLSDVTAWQSLPQPPTK